MLCRAYAILNLCIVAQKKLATFSLPSFFIALIIPSFISAPQFQPIQFGDHVYVGPDEVIAIG